MVFIAVAILSILIAVLHWLGALKSDSQIGEEIPAITLLTVGLIAAYLINERRNKLDRIEHLLITGAKDLVRSLNGVSVKRLGSSKDVYEYVIKRMSTAKHSIDDLTWGSAEEERTPASQAALDRYLASIGEVCLKNQDLAYREVMSFPPAAHLARAKAMLDRKIGNYSLRYYRLAQQMPMVAFMLIDGSEVIVSFYRAPALPSAGEIRFATTHPDIVAFFQDYYETIWKTAEVLQEGSLAHPQKLQTIDDFLRSVATS